MSKTTPEEAIAIAMKYGVEPRGVYPSAFLFYPRQLAALIDELRGVGAEPRALANRAAIEASCKFIEEQIAPRQCDSDGVSSCWRCNSVYLAKRMRDLLNNHPAPSQPAAPAPEGFALVPLRMTHAMQDVVAEESWQWEELLAAAEAITEDQYAEIAASAPSPAASINRPLNDVQIDMVRRYGASKTNDEIRSMLEETVRRAAPMELPVVAWRRAWEGDVSDLCHWLYADEYEPRDDNPNWDSLVRLSDAQAAIAAGRKAS